MANFASNSKSLTQTGDLASDIISDMDTTHGSVRAVQTASADNVKQTSSEGPNQGGQSVQGSIVGPTTPAHGAAISDPGAAGQLVYTNTTQ